MKEYSNNNKRAAFHHVGCKVNAYETEKMKQLLKNEGYEIVPFEEQADVYVINTCSVTAIADKKSRQMIRRARRRNPEAVVVAAGCYVQHEEITPKQLDCDIIIGNDLKHTLVEQLKKYRENDGQRIARCNINLAKEEYEEWKDFGFEEDGTERTRAYIKIQDGCSQFCTYCIIPYMRGRTRSRSADAVVDEIKALVDRGFKEAVLTGIHISSYKNGECDLAGLCERIDSETGIQRLRLGSLEPGIVTSGFAERLSALSCICPHFHLSLQSGCDSVIERMNRSYNTESFAAGVGLLRKYFDNPAVTTDIIAGFPQETEEEFEQTKAFVKQIGFFEMHVFPFSARKGTKAAVMQGQVSGQIRRERTNELISIANVMSEEYLDSWKEREAEVLWEKSTIESQKKVWSGHTREYIKVKCVSDRDLKNTITRYSFDQGMENTI